jgi:hypothetical protein
MRDAPFSADEAAKLKKAIIASAALAEECRIDLIVSPVSGVVNCRVEVRTPEARKLLVENYCGVSVGSSVYFTVPRRKARMY